MTEVDDVGLGARPPAGRPPFYPRLLRLRNIHPNAWQRAFLGEGMAVVGYLLSPGGMDLAPFWAIPVLPIATAAVVKGHDLLAGQLREIQSVAVRVAGEDRTGQ